MLPFLFLGYSEAPQLEELCKSSLLPPQCQDPLTFSLKRCRWAVQELPSAAHWQLRPAHPLSPDSISNFNRQTLWAGEGWNTKATQTMTCQKNFSSWKVNSFLLLWTFPCRLQSTWLAYHDAVWKISRKQVSYKPKNNFGNTWHWTSYLEATTEQSLVIRELHLSVSLRFQKQRPVKNILQVLPMAQIRSYVTKISSEFKTLLVGYYPSLYFTAKKKKKRATMI